MSDGKTIITDDFIYVARDLRFTMVKHTIAACGYPNADHQLAPTLSIVFYGDNGKETRCHLLTATIIDEVTREMLRFEDEYLSGSGKVTSGKYEKVVERWLKLREAAQKAGITK